jgi:hypothetical protein
LSGPFHAELLRLHSIFLPKPTWRRCTTRSTWPTAIDNRYDFKGKQRQGRAEREGQSHHPPRRLRLPARPDQGSSSFRRWKRRRRRAPSGSTTAAGAARLRQQGQAGSQDRIGIEQELAKKIVKLIKDSASSRCRPRSRATRCASPAPSATNCRASIALVKNRLRIFRSSTEIFATEINWHSFSTTEAGRSRSSAHP